MHQEPYPELTPDSEDNLIMMSDAEDILLGEDPTKNWTPEQRKEVEDIFKTLDRMPVPEETDLRKHFRAGEIIKDPQGLRIAVRSVGKSAMCVEVLGKRGRFKNGFYVNIGEFAFMTTAARRSNCVFELLGPSVPVSAPAQIPNMQPAEDGTALQSGRAEGKSEEEIMEQFDKAADSPDEEETVNVTEGVLF